MEIVPLTKTDFLKKISDYETNPNKWEYKGEKPCIVDFYADWSTPSIKVTGILKELAEEYAGQIDIYKVNTDKEEDLASAFGIRIVPSVLLCPVNNRPKMAKGSMSKTDFRKAIKDVLFENINQ